MHEINQTQPLIFINLARYESRERRPAGRPPADSPELRGQFAPREKYGLAKKRHGPTIVQRTRLQLPLLPTPPPDEDDLELTTEPKLRQGRGRQGGAGEAPTRPMKLDPFQVIIIGLNPRCHNLKFLT